MLASSASMAKPQTVQATQTANAPWSCGDPVNYQGYDYATVQIGDQCWFAENLRSENYENGDAIPAGLSGNDWYSSTQGLVGVYGSGSTSCDHSSSLGDACDEEWSLIEFGRLYNWHAVSDARGLCPTEWHVPLHAEFASLLEQVSYDETRLQTTEGWGFGNNQSGFSARPGGGYLPNLTDPNNLTMVHYFAGEHAYWWSSSPEMNHTAWALCLFSEGIMQPGSFKQTGYSIRCIKDVE